jgi:hypothetical protein
MPTEAADDRIFAELQELVAMEVKDILATAIQEGFAPRDVISALELALRAEIEALATNADVATDPVEGEP